VNYRHESKISDSIHINQIDTCLLYGWFCKHPHYWNPREHTPLQTTETHLTETINSRTNTGTSIGKLSELKPQKNN